MSLKYGNKIPIKNSIHSFDSKQKKNAQNLTHEDMCRATSYKDYLRLFITANDKSKWTNIHTLNLKPASEEVKKTCNIKKKLQTERKKQIK